MKNGWGGARKGAGRPPLQTDEHVEAIVQGAVRATFPEYANAYRRAYPTRRPTKGRLYGDWSNYNLAGLPTP